VQLHPEADLSCQVESQRHHADYREVRRFSSLFIVVTQIVHLRWTGRFRNAVITTFKEEYIRNGIRDERAMIKLRIHDGFCDVSDHSTPKGKEKASRDRLHRTTLGASTTPRRLHLMIVTSSACWTSFHSPRLALYR
jgi:hypothetical protein